MERTKSMRIVGYHRTSTTDQHLERGIHEIKEFCSKNNLKLSNIFTDQRTGKNFNRPRYTVMKEDVLEPYDILIVTELDRLGRNKEDTLKELRYYQDKKIRVMILEIPTTLVDLSSMEESISKMIMQAINNMLIEMYAVFAQAEIEKKEKRQREGIEQMKARGEWDKYGRPRKISKEEFAKAYEDVENGLIKPFECMRKLNLNVPTYYRYRQELKEQTAAKILHARGSK
jgi:DNA invertase Pin-like site-specific DNA recombinase